MSNEWTKAFNDYRLNNKNQYKHNNYSPNEFVDYANNPNATSDMFKQKAYEMEGAGKRTALDRFFDVLSTGQYVSQGVIHGMVTDDSVIGSVGKALKASNPFGKDYKDGEYTFGQNLEDMGWQPKSTLGKVLKGTVGFAGDVLFDPSTYMTMGGTAFLKGTGTKIARKASSEAVEKGAKKISIETIDKFTKDQAERALKNLHGNDYVASADEITDLVRRVNKRRGIAEGGKDFGIHGNELIFGDKIAPKIKLGNKSLADLNVSFAPNQAIRELGDRTVAPYVNAILDKFAHSSKFSTKGALIDLARENPNELVKVFEFMDSVTANSRDFEKGIEEIRDNFKKLEGLDPKVQENITHILEDKDLLKKVYDTKPLSSTKEGKSEIERMTKIIDKYSDMQKNADNIKNSYKVGDDVMWKSADYDYPGKIVAEYGELNGERWFKVKGKHGTTGVPESELTVTKVEPSKMSKDEFMKSALHDQIKKQNATPHTHTPVENTFKMQFNNGNKLPDKWQERILNDKATGEMIDTHTGEVINIKNEFKGYPKQKISSAKTLAEKQAYLYDAIHDNRFVKEIFDDFIKNDSLNVDVDEKLLNSFFKAYNDGDLKAIASMKHRFHKDLSTAWEALNYKYDYAKLRNLSNKGNEAFKQIQELKKQAKAIPDELEQAVDKGRKAKDELAKRMDDMYKMFNDVDYMREQWDIQHKANNVEFNMSNTYEDSIKQAERAMDKDNTERFYGQEKYKTNDVIEVSKNGNKEYNVTKGEIEQYKKSHPNQNISDNEAIDYIKREKRLNNIGKNTNTSGTEKVIIDKSKHGYAGNLGDEGESATELKNKRDKAKDYAKKKEADAKFMDDVLNSNYEDAINNYSPHAKQEVKPDKPVDNIGNSKFKFSTESKFGSGKDITPKELKTQINKTFKKSFDSGNSKEFEKIINDYNTALASEKNFETFMRAKWGDKRVDRAMRDSDTIRYMFEGHELDKETVKVINDLREQFFNIGRDEVRAGKLSMNQFMNNMHAYVAHILTPEGIDHIKKAEKEGKPVTDLFGVGGKFNKNSLSRTYKAGYKLPNGDVLKKGTIKEINEKMNDMLNGNKLFADKISDIYLSRMLAHNELMYDHRLTQDLTKKFGKLILPGSKAPEGTKAVLSIGDLRKYLKGQNDEYTERIAKLFGMEKEDVFRAPFLELGEDQIRYLDKYHKGLPKFYVNEIMVNKANRISKAQMKKDVNGLLKFVDKFTALYKINVTAIRPAFHGGNIFSNAFQNYLDVGTRAINPKLNKVAMDVIMGKEGKYTILGKEYKYSELRDIAQRYNAVDTGQFATELGGTFGEDGILKKVIKSKLDKNLPRNLDPTDVHEFTPYRVGRKVGGNIENQARMVNFLANLETGKTFKEAKEHVDKFLFDYSDITDFEADVMRRIFPFYTWLRKNAPLQLEQIIENPNKFRVIEKALDEMEGTVDEKDKVKNKPRYAEDWRQTPITFTNKDGKKKHLMLSPRLPMNDINRIPTPFAPKEALSDMITQSNPLIKIPVELGTNHNYFFDSPIGNKAEYLTGQHPMVNDARSIKNKSGLDRFIEILDTSTGVGVKSY